MKSHVICCFITKYRLSYQDLPKKVNVARSVTITFYVRTSAPITLIEVFDCFIFYCYYTKTGIFTMLRLSLSASLILIVFFSGFAQTNQYDMLYFADGRVASGVIVDVTAQNIEYKLADSLESPARYADRSDVALAFKRQGDYLLASQPDADWKPGASKSLHKIITIDGLVLSATDIDEKESIIYYQDAYDGSSASVLPAEVVAIIYKNGRHKLMANANEVALGLSKVVDTDTYSSTEVKKALELNEVDYEEYAQKAITKADYLGHYLNLICNQSTDMYDKDNAIENALTLFVSDSALVQVSSLNKDKKFNYTIKQYLRRLSLLDYDRVELLWRNIQYVTKFRLAPDGNYYGAITVEQQFRGFKDGRPIYQDITQKDIEIVLSTYQKEESGQTEYAWDVLLSDIGVEETRRP